MAQVNLVKNVSLDSTATGGQTGLVHEPTAAAFLDEVFVSGNWFASHSSDGGDSWSFTDPYSTLPSAAGGFCCDQVTIHERSRNLFLWLLQYDQSGTSNVFRLAVSTSGAPGPWFYWDFSPVNLNPDWGNLWFDYPDMATSDNNLYITYNMFDNATPNNFVRSVVFKIPIDGLVKRNLQYEYYPIATHGSLRLTRGAGSSMFFASHRGGNPITVFSWPDAQNSTLSSFEVSGRGWSRANPNSSPASSLAPDGSNWLGRIDSRITAGWVVGSQAGFLWTANTSSGRSQPYVKALIVDTDSQALVSEPDIWDNSVSWAYPAACPNADGVVGISMFYGGGAAYPTHSVGFLNGAAWVVAATISSTQGPADNTWGDYLSCEMHDPDGTDWIASGYSLQGGNKREFIQTQFVRFGASP